jgi:hypothetical protein
MYVLFSIFHFYLLFRVVQSTDFSRLFCGRSLRGAD